MLHVYITIRVFCVITQKIKIFRKNEDEDPGFHNLITLHNYLKWHDTFFLNSQGHVLLWGH